jgi:hypothetical protein
VQLTAASFARARVLVVRDERGAIHALAFIQTEPTKVSFPVRFRRRARFFLSTRPAAESIAATTGGSDTRVVSVQVASPMTFVPGQS